MLDNTLQSVYFAQRTDRDPSNAAVEVFDYRTNDGRLYSFADGSVLDVNSGGRFAYVSIDDYQDHVEHSLDMYEFDAGTGLLNALHMFCEID